MSAGRSALTNMLRESKRLLELLDDMRSTRWDCSVGAFGTHSGTVVHLWYSLTCLIIFITFIAQNPIIEKYHHHCSQYIFKVENCESITDLTIYESFIHFYCYFSPILFTILIAINLVL